jgi:hypothetical protein
VIGDNGKNIAEGMTPATQYYPTSIKLYFPNR